MCKFDEQAKILCDAIRNMNDYSIDNFESYLSYHFDVWMQKFAHNPDGLADEFRQFSNIKE